MLNVIQKFSYVELCNYNNWNNAVIMEKLFEKYLKRGITIANIEQRKVFTEWLSQKSGIVKFFSILQTIYSENYIFFKKKYKLGDVYLKLQDVQK